jgi:hypothetical protein
METRIYHRMDADRRSRTEPQTRAVGKKDIVRKTDHASVWLVVSTTGAQYTRVRASGLTRRLYQTNAGRIWH